MRPVRSAAFGMTMLMATLPAVAETPSIRLTAPAWTLSPDSPLRRERPASSAVEVELPGYLHNPPLAVPDRPGPDARTPGKVRVDLILAAMRPELGIADPILIHAEAYYGDFVLVLAFVRSRIPRWSVFALTNRPGEGWRNSDHALSDATIEAVAAGWDENGWIEVIPGDVIAARD